MERLEQIKQAAFYDSVWTFGNVRKSFIHGALWSDHHPKSPWIKVEQRLPPVGETVFVKRIVDGRKVYNRAWYGEDDMWRIEDKIFKDHANVIEWMPIPD